MCILLHYNDSSRVWYINCTIFTARVHSTREGNVLIRICPSTNLSVHGGGGGWSSRGGSGPAGGGGQVQPGGSGPARGGGSGPAAQGGGGQVQLGGDQVQPTGGVRSSWRGRSGPAAWGGGQVQLAGGVRSSCGGWVRPGGGQVQPAGGGVRSSQQGRSAKIGQQNEYSLHGGQYASCVHAGGLSCSIYFGMFTKYASLQLTIVFFF